MRPWLAQPSPGRCQPDAAAEPAPATEGAGTGQALVFPYHHADSATRCARAMPTVGVNAGPPLFLRLGESFLGRGDPERSVL